MDEVRCPSCGTKNPAAFRFCGSCGAALTDGSTTATTRSAASVEERKVVTVVFADLEASTALASRLDPEDLRQVLRPFFDAMLEEIERYGGVVEKFIGDAVVGIFGVPTAHEDDPERAVRAALAMQRRLSELNERLAPTAGGELAMRIGVNTGEVIAAAGDDREGRITGESVNVAARLQTYAPRGTVVVGERTFRQSRHAFGFRSLGEANLKGLDRPIPAWQVVPEERPSAGPAWLRSPMVGRDEEIDLLALLYRRTVKERRPSLVTVVGPPGIGKSRLAHEFATLASEPPQSAANGSAARILRGRCLPYGEGLTYWPLAEILKSDAGILDTDGVDAILDKVRLRVEPALANGDGPALTQVLLSSIGIPISPDPLAGLSAAAAQQTIATAWRRYFDSLCADRALIGIVEDIHWADSRLLSLIEHLTARVNGPAFFLCLARPELAERRSAWAAGLPNATSFGLSPLNEADGRELIQNLLGEQAPPEVRRLVLDRSEGNPFFAGELIRMMMEDGTLEPRNGSWALVGPLPASLPDTVQGVLASRIDLLRPQDKQTIQDAAVVGRIFWEGALERLRSSAVTESVDRLIDKGLVGERDESSLAGQRELIFSHVLIRDVAYATIPRARRPAAHAAVMHWIEEMTHGRDEEFAEILAHHAGEAGDTERTARYAMLAGHRHRRVFAAEEAIRWYDRALAAARQLPPEEAVVPAFESALSRGEASEQLGRYAEARADYERALEVVRAAGSKPWHEARALAALVNVLWMEERYEESLRLIPTALEQAHAAGQIDLVVRLLYTQGTIAFGSGRFDEALRFHAEALHLALETEDLEGEALAEHGLAESRLFVGPLRDGFTHASRADELLRRLGQKPMVHHNEYVPAWLHWMVGDLDAAVEAAGASLAGCREVGNRRDEAFALVILGLAELSRGHLDIATDSGNRSVAIALDGEAPRLQLVARGSRVYACAELGKADELRDDVAAALTTSERLEGSFFRPVLVALRGWFEAMSGDDDAAQRSFDEAHRLAAGRIHDLLMVGWTEVLCREDRGTAAQLRGAGERLLRAAPDEAGLFRSWACYATALAALRDGAAEKAAELAASAGAPAAVGAQLGWRLARLLTVAAEARGADGDARRHRAEADGIVRTIAGGIQDPAMRQQFMRRADVAAILSRAEASPAGRDASG